MLHNAAYKLNYSNKLSVAYFGGSITDGAGASNADETSYRAQTTKYLKRRFPEADITEINAAIGGTGTGLGMFRVKRDVMWHNPDLIFIEFAINDFGDDTQRILRQTESIIRHIRRTLPQSDIVFLFSTSEEVVSLLNGGGVFSSREAQRRVCEHYGIDTVDLGEALRAHIAKTGEKYVRYAPDTLHPNDDGYRIFADCLEKYLLSALQCSSHALTPHSLPEKLSEESSNYGDIIELSSLEALELVGFEIKNKSFDRFNSYAVSNKDFGEIRFNFKGKRIGICRLDGSCTPELTIQIDGGEELKLGNPNSVVRSFEKLAAVMYPHKLNDRVHTVRLKATSSSDFLVIGGIYVCSDEE